MIRAAPHERLPSFMMTDEIDEKIIALLQEEPQRANKNISEVLGVTEALVAARIRNLIDANIIRFVAQRDITAFGEDVIAHADLYIEGRPASDVARELGKIESVTSVVILTGSPQLIAQIHAADGKALTRIIEEEISTIRGVERLELCVSLDVIKYRSDVAELS